MAVRKFHDKLGFCAKPAFPDGRVLTVEEWTAERRDLRDLRASGAA